MERTLYHGSQIILEKPEYGKGARNNDYGRGFYCTEEIELAREWACAKQTNGYVNQYKLDLEGLQVMRVLGKNMAYFLQCKEAASKAGIEPPEQEPMVFTNFIR